MKAQQRRIMSKILISIYVGILMAISFKCHISFIVADLQQNNFFEIYSGSAGINIVLSIGPNLKYKENWCSSFYFL